MGSGTLSKPQNKRSLHSCLPACWIPINLTALTKCPRIAEPVQSINIWHTMAQIHSRLSGLPGSSTGLPWWLIIPPCQHTASSFLYILQVSSLHISVLQILHEERPFPKYYLGCGQSEYNHSLIFTIFFQPVNMGPKVIVIDIYSTLSI